MTRFARLAALLTVLLMVLASAAPALGKRADSQEVPIKGTVEGVHWIVEPGDVAFPDECEGFAYQFNSSGKGTLSHLGEVDYFLTHCTKFDPGPQWVGTITFTAANGDTLVVQETGYAGLIEDPPDGALGVEGTRLRPLVTQSRPAAQTRRQPTHLGTKFVGLRFAQGAEEPMHQI